MNVTKHLAAASFVLLLTAMTGALAAPPAPPGSATLTIPSPFGTSPVLAWSWGASNPSSAGSGSSGVVAGKANLQDLALTRNSDGQSPLFLKYLVNGTSLLTVVLVDGSTNITMTKVLVTSYSTGDSSAAAGPGPASQTAQTESITLNFAALTYTVNGVATCVGQCM
jgi:type VI protein secretion system component Hcp